MTYPQTRQTISAQPSRNFGLMCRKVPGGRLHIPVPPHAFDTIAVGYPVFRVDTAKN